MTNDPPAQSASTIDRQWVLAQIGGDETLLHDIAVVFLVDSPDLRRQLNQALADNNHKTLLGVAHCAKSAVGNFGVPRAVQAALTLEDAAKAGDTPSLAGLTAALCAALIEVEDALRPETLERR